MLYFREANVAQGSLSSLAASPPGCGPAGAAQTGSEFLSCGVGEARATGRTAGPECGHCALMEVILRDYFGRI